ncbi:MAG: hypothetical protein K0R65_2680 [Crocinitomicaceae bacterium]|jgi:hypothetical protein|nr:hypothetical protein [Crocinitomicaceae bacterium]
MNDFEIIHFSLWGLKLQEPMALLTNWLIAFFCFFALLRIKWSNAYPVKYFRMFYLVLGISMIFGGLGHLLFQYFGLYGKIPSWILGTLAGYYIGKGVLYYWKDHPSYRFFNIFLVVKSIVLLILSLVFLKFIYVAVDVIITYIMYSGYIAFRLWMKNKIEMRFFVYGIIILFPSMFIFLMNINLHRYLNRDDLSHVLMLACIILFYEGVKRLNMKYSK